MSTTKLQTREFLTTRQRSILITSYNRSPYPSATERHQLVQLTGRTLKQIQDWFSNRRRSDPNLIAVKSIPTPQPPLPSPSPTMETSYYYNLPPPTLSICPCCGLPQSFSTIDQSLYPPMVYYHQSNNFHS